MMNTSDGSLDGLSDEVLDPAPARDAAICNPAICGCFSPPPPALSATKRSIRRPRAARSSMARTQGHRTPTSAMRPWALSNRSTRQSHA